MHKAGLVTKMALEVRGSIGDIDDHEREKGIEFVSFLCPAIYAGSKKLMRRRRRSRDVATGAILPASIKLYLLETVCHFS